MPSPFPLSETSWRLAGAATRIAESPSIAPAYFLISRQIDMIPDF